MTDSPFLTIEEAAAFLRWETDTLRKKMTRGIFKQGVHYFKRHGEIGVRFDRRALEQWVMEGGEDVKRGGIPMARGYVAGGEGE